MHSLSPQPLTPTAGLSRKLKVESSAKLPGTQGRVIEGTHFGALGTVLSTLHAFTHLIPTMAQGRVEQYALFNLFLLSFFLFGWVHT